MMTTRRDVLAFLASSPLLFRSKIAAGTVPGSMSDPIVTNLAEAFVSPPDSARPYVLWMWMGSNISKEGITRDLEAMKEAGIGGATIFSLADTLTPWAGVILKSPTPEIITFTKPWWTMVRHAAIECRRLGLDLILHNCAGYESSGGPWVTPDMSMQEIVWSEHHAEGGKRVTKTLTCAVVDPHPHAQFPTVYIPSLGKDGIPIVEARRTYYRDIAVIAVPSEGTPTRDQIIDLTERMSPAGELTWDAPIGNWSIYRFGHTTTGAMIQPAQWGAMGLECDKMSVEAVTFHCRHVLDDIKRHVGDLIGNPGLSTFYFDSYEAGNPTWTPKMREEFKARRGYDLLTFLPIMAGRVLISESETTRFKQDFKRTVMDLYRDCYWKTPRSIAHEYGLEFVAEPYEGPWDTTEVVKYLDHANMEFWTHGSKYSPVANRAVNDTAHALGQRIVGAEAFTTAPELAAWQAHPAWLKPIGDAAFCDGVSRFNIHHFVQQPWDAEYKPGNAMGQWGIHLGRYQTWWEPGKAWFTYLWRCQAMLQTGNFIPASARTSARFSVRQGSLDLQSIHRLRGKEHIYFVANVARSGGSAQVTFPVTGLQPELWDPVWGTMRDLQDIDQSNGSTSFSLDFAPAQSFFIIFRKPRNAVHGFTNSPIFSLVTELVGKWNVQFDPTWGGPASIQFASLSDWSMHADKGIRFYSGTATYTKTLNLPDKDRRTKLWLDLGSVKDIAVVTVNGKKLGTIWTAPWRVDISSAVVQGDNNIEIAVTNGWANRLIGDEQEPPDIIWQMGDPILKGGYFIKELPDWFLKNEARPSKGRYTFTTWNYFHNKDIPLLPSGLLGPVKVMLQTEAP
ncbi:MAG TPA: glycosyl hydrolase [Edaphobacter sp.]|nr:glycosyl hydrolase [Edaphobacter sp.]